MDGNSIIDDSSVISRRRYLQTVSALGVSAVSAQSTRAEGDVTEIVVTRDSDGPVGTRVVPTKWYNHTQKTRKTSDSLKQRLLGHTDIASIGIGTGESTIGGLKEKVIEVSLEGKRTPSTVGSYVAKTSFSGLLLMR